MIIVTKNHWAVGAEWPVTGSRGDEYTVEMKEKGFYCDCPARVKCKHIKIIETKFL